MKKGNVLLVVILLVIAGLIVALSIYFTNTQSQKPVEQPVQQTPTTTTPPPAKPKTLTEKMEESFDKGLTWLMKKQMDNGAWPNPVNEPDVAFTALAIISAGKAPQKYQETYKVQLEKGTKYIVEHLQANGAIIDSEKPPTYAVYKTSLALVALTAFGKDKNKETIDKAMGYLTGNQFGPEDGDQHNGGWGYQEKGVTATKNANLSTTQFAMLALHEAGLSQDSETWKNAVEFLNKTQNYSEYNKFRVTPNDGGFAYSPVESKVEKKEILADGTEVLKSYASMTYAGLLSFIYANVDKKDPRVQAAYNWIKQHYSLEENVGLRTDEKPKLGKQGLYYYYHTVAKALDAYGEKIIVTIPDKTEHYWANDLAEKLMLQQKADGFWINDAEERWFEGYNGLATSYSLMALNTCRNWLEEKK